MVVRKAADGADPRASIDAFEVNQYPCSSQRPSSSAEEVLFARTSSVSGRAGGVKWRGA